MWRSGVGDLSNKKGGMSRSDRRLKPLCAKKAVLNFVGNPPPHVLPGGLGMGRKIFSYTPWHNTKVVIDLRFPQSDQVSLRGRRLGKHPLPLIGLFARNGPPQTSKGTSPAGKPVGCDRYWFFDNLEKARVASLCNLPWHRRFRASAAAIY